MQHVSIPPTKEPPSISRFNGNHPNLSMSTVKTSIVIENGDLIPNLLQQIFIVGKGGGAGAEGVGREGMIFLVYHVYNMLRQPTWVAVVILTLSCKTVSEKWIRILNFNRMCSKYLVPAFHSDNSFCTPLPPKKTSL